MSLVARAAWPVTAKGFTMNPKRVMDVEVAVEMGLGATVVDVGMGMVGVGVVVGVVVSEIKSDGS